MVEKEQKKYTKEPEKRARTDRFTDLEEAWRINKVTGVKIV